MNHVYPALGTPGVGFFMMLVIGAIAGWIAERVTKSSHGLLTNIIVGIAGSFVSTQLADLLNIAVRGTLGHIVAATAGAIILLLVWQAIRGRRPQ
jgi:uncharacterized membrane protein YeaQ/YmgE (transglycosylase-associated protein family)